MKELLLTAFGYDTQIRFTDDLVDQFEDTIIFKARKRTDVLLFSNSRYSIVICFSSHRSMMEFAAEICKLCIPL